jgi:hypothetical protein
MARPARATGVGRSGCGREFGPAVEHELYDVLEGGEVAQLEVFLARDVVGLANGGEGLGLLHGVDAEVRLEVEIEVEHVGRVAGLLGHDGEHLLRHRSRLRRRRSWRRRPSTGPRPAGVAARWSAATDRAGGGAGGAGRPGTPSSPGAVARREGPIP